MLDRTLSNGRLSGHPGGARTFVRDINGPAQTFILSEQPMDTQLAEPLLPPSQPRGLQQVGGTALKWSSHEPGTGTGGEGR